MTDQDKRRAFLVEMEERRAPARRTHRALVERGVLAPVDDVRGARWSWQQCDLASMIEGAFGERVDPGALEGHEQARWLKRLQGDFRMLEPDERYFVPFWILDGAQVVGIVALDFSEFSASIRLTSLYIFHAHRRQGHAGRVVRQVYELSVESGLRGMRLSTYWTWQEPLRLYLKLGMYVVLWKRDIGLGLESDLPLWRCTFDGDRAEFAIQEDGVWVAILRGRRDGERLRWWEDRRLRRAWVDDKAPLRSVVPYAAPTFAMVLALAGWPLIRSRRRWQRRYHGSDLGGPESLAYKITIFETYDRFRGWRVETPAIPGVEALTRHLRAEYLADLQEPNPG